MNEKISKVINVFSYAFLGIAIVLSFCTVFFALDYTDSFYHGCNFLLANKVSTFLPLTQGLYLTTNAIFGDYVLAYRIVNWLVYFSACLVVYFALVYQKGQSNAKSLWLLAMAIIAIPLTNTNVFNGNSLSSLFLTLAFVSCYKYSNGNKNWLWGLPIAITCAILSRFPNIVMVAMVLAVACMVYRKKDLVFIIATTIGAVIIYLLVESGLFGGLHNYFNAVSDAFAQNAAGSDTDHSAGYLLKEYLHTLKDMMCDIKYLSIIAIIPFLGYFFKNKNVRILCAIAFLFAQIVFLYLRVDLISDVINYFLLVYFYSNICILTFILCILSLLRRDIKAFGLYLFPLLLSLCAAAGSDTGLCLIGGPLFVMLPWLIQQFNKYIKSCNSNEIIKIIVALFLFAVCAAIYVRNGMMWIGVGVFACIILFARLMNEKELKLPALVLFDSSNSRWIKVSVILTFILALGLIGNAKWNVSFHDRPVKELTCQYDVPQFKGIWTNPISKDFLESVMEDYNTISRNKQVIFFGRNSALFSYITRTGMVNGVNFAQEDSERNITCLKKAIVDMPIVFLCPANPGIQSWTTLEDYPKTNAMLESEGYTCVNKGTYAIYYPNENLN